MLSKEQRHNPFVEPPQMRKQDLEMGVQRLQNKQLLPRDIDVQVLLQLDKPMLNHFPATLFRERSQQLKNIAHQHFHLDERPFQNSLFMTQIELEDNVAAPTHESTVRQVKHSHFQITLQLSGPLEDHNLLKTKMSYGFIWGKVLRQLRRFRAIMLKYKLKVIKLDAILLCQLAMNLNRNKEKALIKCMVNHNIANDIITKGLSQGHLNFAYAYEKVQNLIRMYVTKFNYKRLQKRNESFKKV